MTENQIPFLIRTALLLALGTLSAHAQIAEWTHASGRLSDVTDLVGDSSSLYCLGRVDGQIVLGKYDLNGSELWTRKFGSSTGVLNPGPVEVVDSSGVYVVVGAQLTAQSPVNSSVLKYDPDGKELWTRNFPAYATGVALDATGVYVVAFTYTPLPGQTKISPGEDTDGVIRKYDLAGNELWTREFGSPVGASPSAVALGPDAIFVAGSTSGNIVVSASADAFLRRFDLNGNEKWSRFFGSTSEDDYVKKLALAGGSIYVDWFIRRKDYSYTTPVYLSKYDTEGNQLWVRQVGINDSPKALAVAGSTVITVGYNIPGVANWSADGYVDWDIALDSPAYAAAVEGGVTYVAGLGGVSPPPFTTAQLLITRVTPPPPGRPTVLASGVVNAANYLAPPAPGSIAVIFGSQLTDGSTILSTALGPDRRVVTTLGGASVKFGGIPAPLLYATPRQLAIQIPVEIESGTKPVVQVTVGSQTSVARNYYVVSLAPGFFTFTQDGTGAVAALHQDGVSLVTAANPAKPNEVVSLFGTGFGAVTPAIRTGELGVGNKTVQVPRITVNDIAAEVLFSGLAPGFVGLNQINVRIPPNVPSGPAVQILGANNPVTIAVSR